MNDPLTLSIVAIAPAILSAWLAVYHCADAELHGNRNWWRKSLFRARQRVEYKEFCRDVERKHNADTEYTQQQTGEE